MDSLSAVRQFDSLGIGIPRGQVGLMLIDEPLYGAQHVPVAARLKRQTRQSRGGSTR